MGTSRHQPPENIMATITIHTDTFRDACCASTEDLAVFDENSARIFESIRSKASVQGMTVEVKDGRSHGPSYTVDGDDYQGEEAAHEFMQSPAAEFWSQL